MSRKGRKGHRRANRLTRHIKMMKETGAPSPWLLKQCMENKEICRRVLPGLVDIAHPPKRDWVGVDWVRWKDMYRAVCAGGILR